ncbi:hypothetical protein [Limnofasciculus baicalensis]|uniref:Integral membrane protein n=1 Tax=Limnofasciculus baicalensis BBK-W-15 TaxID=2699891 RepID=A0AAE3GRB4_9CYAN|nr:hypothetical protein [Limnofasciculus baicalensis]MCP2729266.1 hypothetical protein [Limnofasciculus baicalensis BBK-W-15]
MKIKPLNFQPPLSRNRLLFVAGMWLLSRLVIAIAMLMIAPSLPAPPGGFAPIFSWEVFSYWDSGWYEQIARSGYEYVNDNNGHSVAFFPLFPLVISGVMSLGVPFAVAGTIVSNFSFFVALLLLYLWVEESHGINAARWATAGLAWCPFSLFGTVIYTEGLFLFVSIAALRAFDKEEYFWAAFWGMLTTATRVTGAALIPAFLLVTWREGRVVRGYFVSMVTSAGLLLYILYCGISFGEPFAFLLAQKAWQPRQSFFGEAWLKMLVKIVAGTANCKAGFIKDPWHPILFLLICACAYLLWRNRVKLGSVKTDYGFCTLVIILWLLAGSPLINTVMIFGGGYLLWYFRNKLRLVAASYGFFSFALFLASGRTVSAERYVYGIVSVAIALGLLLARYPRWGYPTMGFFAILLASLAVRFAQHLWAG